MSQTREMLSDADAREMVADTMARLIAFMKGEMMDPGGPSALALLALAAANARAVGISRVDFVVMAGSTFDHSEVMDVFVSVAGGKPG